uniref:G-protein coupled receptors family 2 profile 2 domain-containing protein n=1 Tax=Zooxanthella nutricula TaxID=1333877 RepID=A0A6U6R1G9_9DINO|mmetsp:Transcript_68634/g.210415  ORF Transcript_68634/g.210415 Transcript_68634/m.210415 type:complete len:289 (+) Transcript_68634:57-923(+)
MPTIFRETEMELYASYGAAWAVPIVFPLALGLFSQATVYWSHFAHRRRSLCVLSAVIVESVFGVACLVSCVANRAARDYVGGRGMCLWQGFYASWYSLAGIFMFVVNFCNICKRLELRSEVALVAVFAAGLPVLMACLPFWGAMRYMFAVDFCLQNIEETAWAAIFTLAYAGAILVMSVAMNMYVRRDNTAFKIWKTSTALYLVVFFMPTQVIAVMTFANDSAVVNATWLYAVLAIVIHSNQIFVPVIYGWLWTYGGWPSLSKVGSGAESERSQTKLQAQQYGHPGNS